MVLTTYLCTKDAKTKSLKLQGNFEGFGGGLLKKQTGRCLFFKQKGVFFSRSFD